MKPIDVYDKLRGGYYTPKTIAKYIAEWAVRSSTDTVLEPSCGDGCFLDVACARLSELGCPAESCLLRYLALSLIHAKLVKLHGIKRR